MHAFLRYRKISEMSIPLIALLGILASTSSAPTPMGPLTTSVPRPTEPLPGGVWQTVGTDVAVAGGLIGTAGVFSWLVDVELTIAKNATNATKCLSDGDSSACAAPKARRSKVPPALMGAGFGTLAVGVVIKLVAPFVAPSKQSTTARLEVDNKPNGLSARVAWKF